MPFTSPRFSHVGQSSQATALVSVTARPQAVLVGSRHQTVVPRPTQVFTEECRDSVDIGRAAPAPSWSGFSDLEDFSTDLAPVFAGHIRAEGRRQLVEYDEHFCSPLKKPESRRADGRRGQA
jgi:hypothetical protein